MRDQKPTSDNIVAVPVSVRLPGKVALKLYVYAAELGTSAGKLLGSILEDVIPAFEKDFTKIEDFMVNSQKFMVKIRDAEDYVLDKARGRLRPVNEQALKEQLFKRTEPGGPLGRPPKSRSF